MTPIDPERQLAGFIDKFTPEMAARIRDARRRMRKRLPNALELVYDNYNFFVIGYGPNERTGEAIFSLAAHANGLTLFFLQGAGLPDPDGLLQGTGNAVRSLKLPDGGTLDEPAVRRLMATALDRARTPLDPRGRHQLVIKSISAKQRPRRPAGSPAGARTKKAAPARTAAKRAKPAARALSPRAAARKAAPKASRPPAKSKRRS